MTHALHPAAANDAFSFHYAWFAGWRWEHWVNGTFVDESLRSFETREECVRDAEAYELAFDRRHAALEALAA